MDGQLPSVLIVEPDRDTADTFSTLLRLSGYRVLTASDGSTAAAAARLLAPDVIFIELRLHGADGYQVANQLRNLIGRRAVFVAVTGQQDSHGRSAVEGFDRHLLKPADPDEILKLLRDIARSDRNGRLPELGTNRDVSDDARKGANACIF